MYASHSLLNHRTIYPSELCKFDDGFSIRKAAADSELAAFMRQHGLSHSERGDFSKILAAKLEIAKRLGLIANDTEQPGSIVGNTSSGKLVSAGLGAALIW